MANNGNQTPKIESPLNETPKVNTPRFNVVPSLNAVNLSRRLNTLKRKSPNTANNRNNRNNQKSQNNRKNQETPMKRPVGPGLSSEERMRRYARSKNVVVHWRQNPETGEAEMIKEPKMKGGRKTRKGRKGHKSRKSYRRH